MNENMQQTSDYFNRIFGESPAYFIAASGCCEI